MVIKKTTVYKPAQKPQKIFPGGTLTPPVYMPNLFEWLFYKGKQVSENAASEKIFYTVPEGVFLFLTSCWIAAIETANVSTHGAATLTISKSGITEELNILGVKVDHIAGQHGSSDSNSLSYNIPLVLPPKTTIKLNLSGFTTPSVRGQIVGFLVEMKNIPSF